MPDPRPAAAARLSADFGDAVLDVVADIPSGRVMTYGDVAALLGSRAARAVGNVLARRGSEVPWWRVVQASGHVAPGHEDRALEHLRAERTPLVSTTDGFRVDLRRARHLPPG